jgi:hypothetical protein
MVRLARLEDSDGQHESVVTVGGRDEIIKVDVVTCGSMVGCCERKRFRSL